MKNLDAIVAEVHAKGETGMNKTQITSVVQSVFPALLSVINSGEGIRIKGFGTFERKTRAARQGRNPHTGAAIEIPETSNLSFKASSSLRTKV